MWIMVAGPYRSGSDSPEGWSENLRVLNQAALEVFRRGHIPIIGVNLALPVIDVAGQEMYNELMMPISLALAERCDAVLRIGGTSSGADREVEKFQAKGLPVFRSIDEIPTHP